MKTLLFPLYVSPASAAYGLLGLIAPGNDLPTIRSDERLTVTDTAPTPFFPTQEVPRDDAGNLRWEAIFPDAAAVREAQRHHAAPHRCLLKGASLTAEFPLFCGNVMGFCNNGFCHGGEALAAAVAHLLSGIDPTFTLEPPKRPEGLHPLAYAERLWAWLVAQGLRYDAEEIAARNTERHFPEALQWCRKPNEALRRRKGNCLSLSILFLHLLERAGVEGALVLTAKHAMAALFPEGLPEGRFTLSEEALRAALHEGSARLVECTAMTRGVSLEPAFYGHDNDVIAGAIAVPLRWVRRAFGRPIGLPETAFDVAAAPLTRNLSAAICAATMRGEIGLADALLADAPALLSNPLALRLYAGHDAPLPAAPRLEIPAALAASTAFRDLLDAFGKHPLVCADAAPGSGKSTLTVTLGAMAATQMPALLLAPEPSQRDRLLDVLPEPFKPYAFLPDPGEDLRPGMKCLRALFSNPVPTHGTPAALTPIPLASAYFGNPITRDQATLRLSALGNPGADAAWLLPFRADAEAGYALLALRTAIANATLPLLRPARTWPRLLRALAKAFDLEALLHRPPRLVAEPFLEALPKGFRAAAQTFLRHALGNAPEALEEGVLRQSLLRALDCAILACSASEKPRRASPQRRPHVVPHATADLAPSLRADALVATAKARHALAAQAALERLAERLEGCRHQALETLRGTPFEQAVCAMAARPTPPTRKETEAFFRDWASELCRLFPIVLATPGDGGLLARAAFGAVIVDEAGLTPALAPLAFLKGATRFAALGDTRQLLERRGNALSLLIEDPATHVGRLTLSLRGGGNAIWSWLNTTIYDGALAFVPAERADACKLCPPIEGASALRKNNCVVNLKEAEAVAQDALNALRLEKSVLAVSPNREQAACIEEALSRLAAKLRVKTEGFRSLTTREAQGHEADVVLVSMTYTPNERDRLVLGGDLLQQQAAALCVQASRVRLGGCLRIHRSFGTGTLPPGHLLRTLFETLEGTLAPTSANEDPALRVCRDRIAAWIREEGFACAPGGGSGHTAVDFLVRDAPEAPLAIRLLPRVPDAPTLDDLAGETWLNRAGWRVLRLYAQDPQEASLRRLREALH